MQSVGSKRLAPAGLALLLLLAPGLPAHGAPGDVFVVSPHMGRFSRLLRLGDPAGPQDFVANRFTTSQLGLEQGYQIDALWLFIDDFCSWSSNWQLQVVAEDPARPFWPDLGAGAVAGPVGFDASTILPRGTGPACSTPLQVRVDLPDADYPQALRFAVEDGAMSDAFDRLDEDLANLFSSWRECAAGSCNASSLKVRANRVQTTLQGPAFAWRLPDLTIGDCGRDAANARIACLRYVHDNVDDDIRDLWNPDRDVRLRLDFDLGDPQARTAGVFFRAETDLSGLRNHYTVYVDAQAGQLVLDHRWWDEGQGRLVVTTLQQAPLVARQGTLEVEVRGYDPVRIDARVGAASIGFTHVDPDPDPGPRPVDNLAHGAPPWGNILGIAFPDASGREAVDSFRVLRDADLFAVARLPPGESAAMLADGGQEGRESFATLVSDDGGASWTREVSCPAATAGCADCDRDPAALLSLQVVDPTVDELLPRVNASLMGLDLPCCACGTAPFACADAGDAIDSCAGAPRPATRPDYRAALPITISPVLLNDRPADDVNADPAKRAELVVAWLACAVTQPGCTADPGSLRDLCLQAGGADCGTYRVPLDRGWPQELPGLNRSTTTDLSSPPDGLPEGVLYLHPHDLTGVQPQSWIPPRADDYLVHAWELYDFDGDGCFPDPGCPGTSIRRDVDEEPWNRMLRRRIHVSPCVPQLPHNLDRGSLRMTARSSLCAPGEALATWAPLNPPLDPTTPFNMHEIRGWANRDSIANPFPGAAAVGLVRDVELCWAPGAPFDVNYYGLFQADECTAASRADP